jgi:hypothetical protein
MTQTVNQLTDKEFTYDPLLGCDNCKKATRHYFVRTEIREFECQEERRGLPDEALEARAENSKFELLIFRCVECGTERGYGNRDLLGVD